MAPFPEFIHWAPPIQVDLKADDKTMRRLFLRVEHCWEQQGRTEPFWSVLSHDRFKRENFASNAVEFYSGAEADAARLAVWLDRNGVDRSPYQSCLEVGCGVGRVTPWLARQFRGVVACDISTPHMELAAAHLKQHGLHNVEFVHTPRFEAFRTLPAVDVIFSLLVLQHNPPPVIRALLERMFQLLRPGGVAFFQVPTYGEGYRFDIQTYLDLPEHGEIEMHLLPQRSIFDLAEVNRCSVLEVEPDLCVGTPGWISNTFLVRKRPRWGRRWR